MYITPFACGVIVGVVGEFTLLVVLAAIYSKKRK